MGTSWGSSSRCESAAGGNGPCPRHQVLLLGIVWRVAGDQRCSFQLKSSNFPLGPGSGPWQHPQPRTAASLCSSAPSPPTASCCQGEIPSWAFVTDARVFLREVSISVNSNFSSNSPSPSPAPRLLPFSRSPDECHWHAWKLRLTPACQPWPEPSSSTLQSHSPSCSATARELCSRCLAEGQIEPGPRRPLGSQPWGMKEFLRIEGAGAKADLRA